MRRVGGIASFGFGIFLGGALCGQTTPPPHLYLSDVTVVNTDTTNNQRRPSVAVGTDGNYLVVWHSDLTLGYFEIRGQLFDHEGAKIGGEFQVAQAAPLRIQYAPDIAAGGDGNYAVVWADFNSTVTDSEVWTRRFDAAANPLGGAVQVNTYTTGFQRLPRVAAAPDGDFVVVWESAGQDGDGLGVFGQRYDAAGAAVGGEFAVNTSTTGDQDRAAVDMDDAGFTVVFNDGANGVVARDFGTFVRAGDGEYSVFGAGHASADVSRLGAGNTLFASQQSAQGSIVGRRSEAGALQNPFSIAAGGPLGSHSNVRLTKALQETLAAVWETELAGTRTASSQQYRAAPFTSIEEIGRTFGVFGPKTGNIVPQAEQGDDLQLTFVGATGPPDEDIQQLRGGSPEAMQALFFFDTDGSGTLEPGEAAQMSAELRAFRFLAACAGTLGPLSLAPQTLTITDATADYGSIPAGGTADCQATGDCYGISVSGARPGPHWDESVVETLNTGVHKTWLLHIGESFADVPTSNPFYAFIENLLHNGVTAGGACGGYCPTDGVKRQQMAVFLLKSRFPFFTPPPATGTIFGDVPASNPFAAWIEALYLLGITGGCQANPLLYCPDAIVNRQQMAVFLLKTKEGSAYDPPDCAGIFTDVPCTPGAGFSDWIEELYSRQITGGCVANPLQYCPTNPTNRQQMAAFLVKTFELLLYGP